MTSPKDDERAQFEEFLNRRRISTACRADGDYVHGAARDWWVVWQASRTASSAVQGAPNIDAQRKVTVPDEIKHLEDCQRQYSYGDSASMGYRDGWNDCRDEMLHNMRK
ncbi:MAG: hypothetical protein HYX42_00090 [Polaromonas sp.]|uniref:hypothetical protein n=1 Tax=Polaromonas sp. TaxID=1869339 RepID=UPI0025D360A4|nr:hypothetical protein [Polaromonas sp.]MBI2724627.1 hypothetical protein [Polaromonas sp.]